MTDGEAFDEEVREHDRRVEACDIEVSVGVEPTYTRADSGADEWIGAALGADKLERAGRVARALWQTSQPALLLRSVGRQYPGEQLPRWSFGVLRHRDGSGLPQLPPDPVTLNGAPGPALDLALSCSVLRDELERRGRSCTLREGPEPGTRRIVAVSGSAGAEAGPDEDLEARSVHDVMTPSSGLLDAAARRGIWVIRISQPEDGVLRVELPEAASTKEFDELIACLSDACRAAPIGSLMVAGHPPPRDRSRAWTTITPDPGVVEINMAPCDRVDELLGELRRIDAACRGAGLSPERLHYNGEEADSGGGGQITFGGPTPERSPFALHPHLLPRLVRYLLRHPSLSYLFGWERMGSGCQAPRADEVSPESLPELSLALSALQQSPAASLGDLWDHLAPFLTDRFGSIHRAELNIEKLANPFLPGRGALGVVEFRAFRMGATPERVAAHAVLLRSVLAALSQADLAPEVTHWGPELHDRFALPLHLERDLDEVIADLAAAGLAPGPALTAALSDHRHLLIAHVDLGDAQLEVRSAIEFAPLIGDLMDQGGTSRRIDASTRRIEVRVHDPSPRDWLMVVDGAQTPLPRLGEYRVLGVRHRAFVPMGGLHPQLPPRDPLEFALHDGTRMHRITWRQWRPGGEAYPGLPDSAADAAERRRERLSVTSGEDSAPPSPVPPAARTPWALDTRVLDTFRRLSGTPR